MSCQAKIEDQVASYQVAVVGSIALTVGVSVAAAHCLRHRMLDFSFRARFYGTMGIIKVLLAALIVFLVPSCPSKCVCSDFSNFLFYPLVAALIGFRWLSEALASLRQAREPMHHAVAVPLEEPGDDDYDEEQQQGTQMVGTMASAAKADEYKDIPIVKAESAGVV